MKNSTKTAVNELVRLLGGTTWTRTASKCTGKWSGTTDYGILIDGRIKLFVSNGMAGFEPRVREWIASFKTIQVKKDYYLELLREQARRDNATAISEGLYPVHVLDIGIVSPEASEGFYYFYPYVLIEVNGLRYKHPKPAMRRPQPRREASTTPTSSSATCASIPETACTASNNNPTHE